MPEENDCTVELHGNALAQLQPRRVTISRDGEELATIERHGLSPAAYQTLWVVERILRGEQAPLMTLCDGNYRNQETLLSVVMDGRRYLGVCDSSLYRKRMDTRYAFEPAEIDEETVLREFYPVDELQLCQMILEWVERSVENRELKEQSPELTYPPEDELSSLYRDATDMVGYYRHHGSLEGFELSRTKEELERFVFEFETLPRTERYVREHIEVVDEVVLDLIESDLPDQEVVSRLRGVVDEPRDWVNRRVVKTLKEHPDERAWAAWVPIITSDDPELQRDTAEMLAQITHVQEARSFLKHGLQSDDERTSEIAREALEDVDSE